MTASVKTSSALAEQALQLMAGAPLLPLAQAHARAAWLAHSWPTRQTEAWKYTPLKVLANGHCFVAPPKLQVADVAALTQNPSYAIQNLNAVELVFINGEFNAQLSSPLNNLPQGLNIAPMADASHGAIAVFNSAASPHATFLGQLNTAVTSHCVVVSVEKNAHIDTPIHIVNYALGATPCMAHARVLWQQAPNSRATLVEHFCSSQGTAVFTNSITELLIGENAECEHYRLHQEDETALHVGGVYGQLQKHARLKSFYLAMGTQLQRIDVVTQFEGEGGEASNNGVYLPRNKQLTDFHTCIEHKVPHCTSNEVFRGIIGDSAKAVFNGRIHIHKNAQKTLAELSNKNLLTSDKAEVNTKPELEIYADDVRCAHGATIAELDALAMHYLRTRGISHEEAQVMLSFGFINELIEQLTNLAIVAFLRPVIATRFAKKPELLQHLLG